MNRQAVVSNALWGAEVATRQPKQIHYGEVRPIRGAPRQLPLTTDCSGFVTLCYQWAGAPDPNGTHYDGTGSTGTMLHACAHIRPNEAQLADLIVFGAAPGTHVVLIVETGPDPVVVSQGSEAGPLKLPLSEEATAHVGEPLTYLSVSPVEPAVYSSTGGAPVSP
jgi:cell wall-associated NlpC family hydrolase